MTTKTTVTQKKDRRKNNKGRPKQSKYQHLVVAFAKLFGTYLKSYLLKRVF